MIKLNKLRKIAYISFQNSLRLHNDAIALYRDGRYPSSFYLSILAQEEIGKMHIINDYLWNADINGIPADFEEEWLGLVYKHPYKQHSFLKNSPLTNWSPKGLEAMEKVFKGSTEVNKQGSVYVGLLRNKGKIDAKGKVKHPFQITKALAKKQITEINDYLLVVSIGVRFTQYSLGNEEIENEIRNKKFIKDIFRNSIDISPSAIKMIKRFQKFFKEEIIILKKVRL